MCFWQALSAEAAKLHRDFPGHEGFEGYAGLVQPRSGLAFKHGVTVLNTPGLIDSGYRGELKVCLINHDPTEPFEVTRGERIAQLVVQAVENVNFVEVDSLDESERGDKGFGSSGR